MLSHSGAKVIHKLKTLRDFTLIRNPSAKTKTLRLNYAHMPRLLSGWELKHLILSHGGARKPCRQEISFILQWICKKLTEEFLPSINKCEYLGKICCDVNECGLSVRFMTDCPCFHDLPLWLHELSVPMPLHLLKCVLKWSEQTGLDRKPSVNWF